MIVGQFLGVNALAAVGGTGSLMFLVLGWVNGMTSGFSILIAQSFGAGDDKRLRHCVCNVGVSLRSYGCGNDRRPFGCQ